MSKINVSKHEAAPGKAAIEQGDSENIAAIPESMPEASQQKNSSEIVEIDGPEGPEPTRYGDWEIKGRCTDF
ncbi:MAG: succinate dehydrogenase assembly factor 4 [Pseudomonadota bacterium]